MRVSTKPLILFMKRRKPFFDLSKCVFQNIRIVFNVPLGSIITRSVVIASSHNTSSKNKKKRGHEDLLLNFGSESHMRIQRNHSPQHNINNEDSNKGTKVYTHPEIILFFLRILHVCVVFIVKSIEEFVQLFHHVVNTILSTMELVILASHRELVYLL
nr:MAG TPA: hypothetical protein [Caudoviricetes sp.]